MIKTKQSKKNIDSHGYIPDFSGIWLGKQDPLSPEDSGSPIRIEITQSGLVIEKISIFRSDKSGTISVKPNVEKTGLQIDSAQKSFSWKTDIVPAPVNCNAAFDIWEIKEDKPGVLGYEEFHHITPLPYLPLGGGSIIRGLYFPPLTTTSYTGKLRKIQ